MFSAPMSLPVPKNTRALAALSLLCALASPAFATDWTRVVALSVSRLLPNDRFCGVSLFRNSFGQPSAYAFVGKSWPGLWPSQPKVYASVTAGIMYGYVGKYKNKVPLNMGGFSPALIPAVGYRFSERGSLEVQILGTAALMFGTTWRY